MVPAHSISPSSDSRKGAQVTTVQFLQLPLSPGSPLGARMDRPDLLLPLRSQSIFLTTFWSPLSPSQAPPFLDSFHTCSDSPLYISTLSSAPWPSPPGCLLNTPQRAHVSPLSPAANQEARQKVRAGLHFCTCCHPTCQCLTEPPKSFKAVASSLTFGPLPTQFIVSVPFLTMGLLWS